MPRTRSRHNTRGFRHRQCGSTRRNRTTQRVAARAIGRAPFLFLATCTFDQLTVLRVIKLPLHNGRFDCFIIM